MDDDDRTLLTIADVEASGIGEWRMMIGCIRARFATGDFVSGLALVEQIGAAAEEANHHPDVVLTYPAVQVTLTSHDVGGVTRRDVRLAAAISGFAAAAGIESAPETLSAVEIGLDTADRTRIAPFWAAVLGYDAPDGDVQELVDPTGSAPTLWFQQSEPHDEPRQRFHYDIRVPPEQAQARIDAAIAAGGTLVADDEAPAFWVLADADGNKACITTGHGRG